MSPIDESELGPLLIPFPHPNPEMLREAIIYALRNFSLDKTGETQIYSAEDLDNLGFPTNNERIWVYTGEITFGEGRDSLQQLIDPAMQYGAGWSKRKDKGKDPTLGQKRTFIAIRQIGGSTKKYYFDVMDWEYTWSKWHAGNWHKEAIRTWHPSMGYFKMKYEDWLKIGDHLALVEYLKKYTGIDFAPMWAKSFEPQAPIEPSPTYPGYHDFLGPSPYDTKEGYEGRPSGSKIGPFV